MVVLAIALIVVGAWSESDRGSEAVRSQHRVQHCELALAGP
jgi:hypothetical protein